MTAASPLYEPTALDLRVAAAFDRARAVARRWVDSPLSRTAQADALHYLTVLAPGDQALADFWAAEPRLRERLAAPERPGGGA